MIPTISVVIPVGRVDALLDQQVRAVLSQHPPFSFDVVISLNSAASADRAALDEIVRATGDDHVRVVSSADRRGAAHARNVGALHVSAPLLAFCDADDEVKPGWLVAMVRGLESYDVVCGRINEVAPPGQASWRPPATPGGLPTFLGVPYVLSGNLGITRRAFVDVGGFDETLTRCEDIALGWTLLDHGYKIGYVEDAVLDYRHRPGLPALMRQYYLYGRGMAEVVARYPVPASGGGQQLTGLALLRPNRQPAPFTIPNLLRRASIGAGRVVGLVSERRRRQPRPASKGGERRVVYVVTHYPQLTYTFIVDEIRALTARGFEVLPVAMNSPEPTEITSEYEQRERGRTFYLKAQSPWCALLTLGRAFRASPVGMARMLRRAIGSAGFDLKLVLWRVFHLVEALLTWDHCRRHGITHLHAQFGLAPATIAWFACEFGNQAGGRWTWSFTIHGFHDFVNEREAALRAKAASASYVVCVSSFTRSQLMRVSDPSLWEKFHVVRCGIDLDRFTFAPRKELAEVPTILLVGRLSPEKGHGVLLEALSLLRREGVDAIAEFVGSGDVGADLARRAEHLGVSDRVRFLGGLHSSQVPDRLRQADVFCVPSFAEGLPVSIMEAMAVGVPVVTTYVGGIPELAINEETALVVPAGDARSLANAVARMLRDGELRRRLVQNARQQVERQHSLDTNVRELEALLVSRGARR